MADRIVTLTDQNWASEVMASAQPVLVDFWAEWCMPCRTLSPTVEAVAAQFDGRLKVGKMNVEDNLDVPTRYNVSSLPTLLLIKGGLVAEQRIGLISRERLAALLGPHLA
jgi:thioredoxin 1